MTSHKSLRVRLGRAVDEQVEATLAAIGLVILLLAAGLSPNPEIGVVLQAGGVGGAVGLLVAYVRHRDDPDADRWRTVARFSLYGLGVGLLLIAGEALLSA